MSKITNDGLTRSGTGCFIAVPMATVGIKGLDTLQACYAWTINSQITVGYHTNTQNGNEHSLDGRRELPMWNQCSSTVQHRSLNSDKVVVLIISASHVF